MARLSDDGLGCWDFLYSGKTKSKRPVYVGLGIVAVSIGMYFLMSKSQIILDDFGITKKTALKTKAIPLSSIFKTYLKSEHPGKSKVFTCILKISWERNQNSG